MDLCRQSDVLEVSYYGCISVNFFSSDMSIFLYIMCSDVKYIYTDNCYNFLLNWTLFHYITLYFEQYFKVYFVLFK